MEESSERIGFHVIAALATNLQGQNLSWLTRRADVEGLRNEPQVQQLKTLKLVDDFTLTDPVVQILARLCPNLEVVDLSDCHQITDAAVTALASHCPHLQSINLSSCFGVTDIGIAALAQGCPSLSTLDVLNCERISDAAATALAEGCPGLQRVNLSLCREITDAGIVALAQSCHGLRYVHLVACNRVTDSGVTALAEHCADLQGVVLLGCDQITDAAVVSLAQRCSSLQGLSLNMCVQITDAAVKALSQHCPHLQGLQLDGCAYLTPEGLAPLAEHLPPKGNLQELSVRYIPHLGLPEEVMYSSDASLILKAVQDTLAGALRPLLEVKVIVLGEGGAGKTQLCNRLRGKPFEVACDRTADFDTHFLHLPDVRTAQQAVLARLFDFGGQPHLWSAHRFFLASQRNLYIIVLDGTRHNADNLHYWLRYIRHYASGASTPEGLPKTRNSRVPASSGCQPSGAAIPILVVATKSDDPGFRELPAIVEQLRREWPALRVVPRYSSRTDDGLPLVWTHLRELVKGMDYVFEAGYPEAMHITKRWLEGVNPSRPQLAAPEFRRHVSLRQFTKVCRAAAQLMVRSRKTAYGSAEFHLWLKVLRNLGLVLWLGDLPGIKPGQLLADQVYNPQWVKALTYGVIRHGLQADRQPVIRDADLLSLMTQVWCEARHKDRTAYPGSLTTGEKRQMIDLMAACHLIFWGTRAQQDRWFVLDWIANTQGVAVELLPNESSRVTFPDFLPESLLVRLAGHWFAHIGKPRADLHRNQVALWDPACPAVGAVVRADPNARQVLVHTYGGIDREQEDFDAKVRGAIRQVAQEEALPLTEERWLRLDHPDVRGREVDYHLHPPFFISGPQASFDEAWEVFCCQLLNLYHKTDQIVRRTPPDHGVDLFWRQRRMAFQCKSVLSGQPGGFDADKVIESLQTAQRYKNEIGWSEYFVCTNVAPSGAKQDAIKKILEDVQFFTEAFWIDQCKKHRENVASRFQVLVPLREVPNRRGRG